MKRSILFVISVFLIAAPSLAEEVKADAGREIKTKFGVVAIGDTRDKLYKAFPESERLYIPHSILDEEWIVFKDINSNNPNDAVTFYLKNSIVESWRYNFNPSPKNKGSAYELREGEKIGKWFFPAGESKWDGSKLSAIEWNMLTDTQKIMFLSEYVKELEKESSRDINIDTSRYIIAMNHYADTCPGSCFSKPAANVVKELLASDGQIETKVVEPAAVPAAAPPDVPAS